FVLVDENHLALLERALPSFLEQVARLAELHGVDAIVVPTDVTTLASMALRERVVPYPSRRAIAPGDLVFLRTAKFSGFTSRDLPETAPASFLFQKVCSARRALLFGQDFFRQLDEEMVEQERRLASSVNGGDRRAPASGGAFSALRPWRTLRVAMAAIFGE